MKILEKYNERVKAIHSLLCVGLDTDVPRLPQRFKTLEHPQFEFNRYIIEQTHHVTAAYKPNMAFYEARGAAGWHELQMTLDYLRHEHPDIVTICDAKRADIGSTNEAYTRAIFDTMGFDAITLHPYLGHEAMAPFLERTDKACIILCRTSNPGSSEFQSLTIGDKPLWQVVAETVRDRWNTNQNCMLVVGATYPEELRAIRQITPELTFLVPGIGAQGGDVEQTVSGGVDAQGRGLIISASRSIIMSDDPATSAKTLRDDINRHRG